MADKKLNLAPPTADELSSFAKAYSLKDPSSSDDSGVNYGAPTQEELDSFNKSRTPTSSNPDFIKSLQEPTLLDSTLNNIEDTGRGVVQGTTLGGSDELYGAGAATAEKAYNTLTGKQGKDFLELYRKYQQESENANKASKERSPWLYGGGNLAGGLAAGVATAGGGLLAGATEKGAELSLPLLAKIAAQGAGTGVTQGILSSEGNIDTQEGINKLGSDAAISGTIGGVLAPLGAIGANKLSSKLSERAAHTLDDPEAQKLALAYKQGQMGMPIKGEEAGKRIFGGVQSAAKDTAEKLLEARSIPSKEIGGLVEQIDEIPTGQIIDNAGARSAALTADDAIPALAQDQEFQTYKHLINKYAKVLGDKAEGVVEAVAPKAEGLMGNSVIPEVEAVQSTAQEAGPTILKGQNLQALSLQLKKLQGKIQNPNVKGLISETIDDITNTIEQHGGEDIRDLNEKMKDVSSQLPELFTKKQVNQFKSPGSALKEIQKNVEAAILRAGQAGTNPTTERSRATLDLLKQNLDAVKQQYPEILDQLGIRDTESYVNDLADKGKLYDLYKGITQQNPGTGLESKLSKIPFSPSKILGFGAGTSRGQGYLGAYRAGKISQVANNVYNAGESTLLNLTDRLHSAGLTSMADALEKGIQNPNASMKNAVLFTIMQNPASRALVGDMFNEQGGSKDEK